MSGRRSRRLRGEQPTGAAGSKPRPPLPEIEGVPPLLLETAAHFTVLASDGDAVFVWIPDEPQAFRLSCAGKRVTVERVTDEEVRLDLLSASEAA